MSLDIAVADRHAGPERLSLALIEARNRTLMALADFDGDAAAVLLAARAGWWADHWIVRNVQAQRGEACDADRPRLRSIDPAVAAWFEGQGRTPAGAQAPGEPAVRAYMTETLEMTLDLLGAAAHDDAALYFYRLALQHEDRVAEELAVRAQAHGLRPGLSLRKPLRPEREPLWLPAQTATLGSTPGGLVPANERWAHAVEVPEFEIDAQAVNWARFAEFAEDGGYDDPRWWGAEGWTWVQAQQRRAPRYVEQMRNGVLVLSRGQLERVRPESPAVHLTRHEAEAWCAWAGRRLPTEVEWELAATSPALRGFIWGDVREWVAGTARGWPGHAPLPGDLDPMPERGAVLRGCCWLSPPRLAHPRARRFCPPETDAEFCGFRSCAR